MNFSNFTLMFLAGILITSCNSKVDEIQMPIKSGTSVTVTNTFTGTAQTNGVETTIEDFFGQPAGSLAASATVSTAVEFSAYLLGLYDIDISTDRIDFVLVAAADDPTYIDFFRTLEAGTTDRYYLTFDEAHEIDSFTSNDPSVTLRIDSNSMIVVEIGEGFSFNPGSSFSITLN